MRRYLTQTLAYSLQRRIRIRSGGLWTLLTLIGLSMLPNVLQAQCPDVNPPIIVVPCPGNITVGSSGGSDAVTGDCQAAATWTAPQFTDPGPCFLVSVVSTHNPGDLFPVGTTTVTYTATDGGGLAASCSFDVIVTDDEAPVLSGCPSNITLPAIGCSAIATWVDPTATDNCSVSVTSTAGSGVSFPVGSTTVTYTFTDPAGLTDVCSFTVTVTEAVPPVITCPAAINVNVDAGTCAAVVGSSLATATDNCGTPTITSTAVGGGADLAGTYPVGSTTITFTAIDDAGNSASCTTVITVTDNEPPTFTNCPVGTQTVNTASGTCAGTFNYTPAIADNCPGATVAQTSGPTVGTPQAPGSYTVVFTATDAASNTAICTINYDVVDNEAPTIASCPPAVNNLNVDAATCGAVFTFSPTANDNCAVTTFVRTDASILNSGDVFPVGTTTIAYLATDAAGNTTPCSFDVVVTDNVAPTFTNCPTNITVNVDGGACSATVTTLGIVTATDDCGVASITNSFNGGGADANGTYPLGTTTVTYTATDINGQSNNTCVVTVTVVDNIPPTISCPAAVSLNLSADANTTDCVYTVAGTSLDPIFGDNCMGSTISNSFNAAATLDGANLPLGANSITWTVTDGSSLTASCTFVVTVVDNVAPVFSCPANITVNSDVGNCGAVVSYVVTAADACDGPIALTVGTHLTAGLASGSTFPVGTTVVTWEVPDAAGNNAVCSFIVTVNDNEAPVMNCQNIIVQLDASGNVSIVPADVDHPTIPSSDNCSMTLSIGTSSFVCSDVGPQTVVLTGTDPAGNSSSCNATVTVEDNVAPNAICQNINVQLDASGNAFIAAAQIDDGSNDACGIATLSVSPDAFTCANVGANTVTLTVTDNNGNASTCTATVTVADNVAPAVVCVSSNPIVDLDASGNATILPALVDSISTDACGIASRTVSPNAFSCANVGANTVTLTVTDNNGNVSTCTSTIVIRDTIDPVATCQNVTVQLNAAGNGSTTAALVNNGSSDACGIASMSLSQTAFTCANVGANTVTLTVTDNNGNTSTCTATVTVEDNVVPAVVCVSSNPIVDLDAGGNATILPALVDSISTDACGIASRTVSPNTFTCANVGANTVTLTVTDNNGNVSTCTSTIVIRDNTPPAITCPANVTINVDAGLCAGTVSTLGIPTATDICGIASITHASTVSIGGSDANGLYPVGTTTVTFTATDNNGNTSQCTVDVTVIDNEDPVINCPGPLLINNDLGQCGRLITYSITGVDNCLGSSIAQTGGLPSTTGLTAATTFFPVGTTVNTYEITDAAGNTATCTYTVTVVDTESPSIVCSTDLTVNNDPGVCGATVSYVLPVGVDNCPGAITTLTAGLASGSLFPIGTTTVSYLVTDAVGQTAVCDFDVTVIDNEAPSFSATPPAGLGAAPALALANIPEANGYGLVYELDIPNSSNWSSNAVIPYTTNNSGVLVPGISRIAYFMELDGVWVWVSMDAFTADMNMMGIHPGAVTLQQIVNNMNVFSSAGAGVVNGTGIATGNIEIWPSNYSQGNTAAVPGASNATFDFGDGGSTSSNGYGSFQVHNHGAGQTIFALNNWGTGGNNIDLGIGNSPAGNPDWTFQFNAPSYTVKKIYVLVSSSSASTACPADITASNDAGVCNAVVNYPAPIAMDNCPGAVVTQTGGLASGSAFPVGTTTNTFLVTDAAGLTATCSFDVTVNDTENPTIVCPTDITVGNDVGNCTAVVTYNIMSGDNCPGSTVIRTAGLASGSAFPLGTTTITHQITDAAGNTASCSFDIIVNDTEAPAITCPANITVNNDAGNCSAVQTYTAPIGTDNCPGVTTALFSGLASGSAFPVGINTVTYRSTDAVGNVTDCSFTITVVDNEDPVITGCPANIAQANDVGDCGALVTWTLPTVADNCSAVLTGSSAPGDFFPVGTTTVTYTAVDPAGNTAVVCSFDVVISDTESPVATCPANITQNNDASQCNAFVTVPNPTITDNCTGLSTITNDFNGTASADDTYPVGTTTVTFTITDPAGNSTTCTVDVTVVDNENPTILCPFPSQIALNGAGIIDLSTLIFFNQAVDNCPGPITFSFSPKTIFDCSDAGTTTLITITATDAAGNINTCGTALTVVDNVPPIVNCPANITQSVDAGLCSAVVIYAAPTISDNCPGATLNQIAGLASGAVFPVGTTTNTFEVTDAVGLVSTCSFDVTVVDNENPTISCPSDVVQANDAGLCSAVITFSVGFSDNCPGVTISQSAGLASGSAFPVGTTTNTFVVTDAVGNSSTCSFDVTINDTEDPVITCPADITVQATTAQCDAVVSYTLPVVTDNCVTSPVASLTAGLGSGATFPVGTTTETYTFTDPSGNTVTCSFTVTVEDNVPPTLVCPADIVQSNDLGLCSAVVTWPAPVYSDNCAGVAIADFAYVGSFNGNHYYTSNATMTWTAANAMAIANGGHLAVLETATERAYVRSNATGNQLWIGYTDEVVEGTFVPVTGLTEYYEYWAPGQPDNAGAGEDYVFMRPDGRWVDANATTTHAFVLEIGVSQLNSPAPGSVFPVGTTTISYQATDVNGNVSNCSFDITVEDNEDPTIACPANINVNNDVGTCGAVITYLAPTFGDNCGATIAQISGLASGSTFPVGTTNNIFVATDAAGNTSSCVSIVVVTDNEDPTIACPADITVSNDVGFCGAFVTFTTPTFSDNCLGPILTQTAGLSSGSIFPVGTTTNTFLVTDAAGLTATCSFDVVVNDTENPTIVCPANITQSVDVASCDAVISYTAPSFGDNCPGAAMVLTSGLGSGGTFPLGVSTETYTVTDASGNTATCSITITILDLDFPIITCPGDQIVSAPTGTCSAVITYAAVTATDGCPSLGVVTQTAGLASGSTFPLGTTTNTFEVTDAAGNTSTCSFDVTIEDNEDPIISCPANITIFANGGQCTALYNYVGATASDNCGPPTVTLITGLGSGGSFPVGVTTETYQAIDASGNVATCFFTVTVLDNQPPTIACPLDIVLGNDAGICGAVVSYGSPSFTDNCPGSILTQTAGLASGATFPVGTTTNTFLITDPSGNTATCSFDVTVNDTEGPTITCPANITVTAGVGLCDAIVTYAGVTAVDNCPGPSTITLIAGLNSGANFPVGVTTVTYEAVDGLGNSSTCSFTVTVNAAVPITQAVINNAIDPLSMSLEECEDVDINLSASVPNPGAGEAGTWTFIGTPPASFTFTPNANDPNAVLSGVTASPPIYELEWAITDGCITTRDTIRVQINPAPTGIIVETSPISVFGAADGELLAIPLSGTPGYFFEWDNAPTNSTTPSVSGLATATYSVVITDTKGCDDTLSYFLDEPLAQTVLVSPRAFLGGAIDLITGEMEDNLRGLVDFPLTEPYTADGYPALNAGSSLTTNAGVLAVTGSDAIVDWVLVELRDKADRTTILGRQPALIQADGDIVDAGDGVSPVAIIGTPDDYYVTIRHRNHLGVMSDAVIGLNDLTTTLADFSDGSVTPYQLPLVNPSSRIPLQTLNQLAFSAVNGFALWGGDSNGDKIVTYAGSASDISPIQLTVLFDAGNPGFSSTHQVLGYNNEDLNMDSNVTFAGTTTDVSIITINVLLHPDNFGLFNLTFQIFEQIP